MSKRIFTGLICLTFFCHIVNGQKAKYNKEKDNVLRNEIDKILQGQVDSNKIPGAVIKVKQKGSVVFERSYGWAQKYDFNHRELSAPDKMTVEHLFDIASLTKVVGTTTAIMLLVDKGLIKIDDPVGKYIKAFDTGAKKLSRLSLRARKIAFGKNSPINKTMMEEKNVSKNSFA